MMKILSLAKLAFLCIFAVAMLLTGCASQQGTKQPGAAPDSVYETSEQIKAMPPCKARVVHRAPCSVYLETKDGKGLYFGSPGSKADVSRFLGFLKDGQSYDLPGAFLKYQKNLQPTEP